MQIDRAITRCCGQTLTIRILWEVVEMLLSLCMPTNGMIEWVFPALNSIYEQKVDQNEFEIVVTNNGNDEEFDVLMKEYMRTHTNLIYKKTNAYMFDNQLECLKLASGCYLKFVNHRTLWLPGKLKEMIEIIRKYIDSKPVIYFANGVMGWGPVYKVFNNFDEFVRNLGIYGTWTSGVGIWMDDYKKIPKNSKYDSISPHASILYSERKKNCYVIFDQYWMKEIDSDHSKKGKYDLYKAFALDEFIITLNLYRDGDISVETLKAVKESFRKFLKQLYCDFNIEKKPCSYDLQGFDEYIDIFFNKDDIINGALDLHRCRENMRDKKK